MIVPPKITLHPDDMWAPGDWSSETTKVSKLANRTPDTTNNWLNVPNNPESYAGASSLMNNGHIEL